MAKSLVVVESPAKARTIEKYLGPEYIVEASAGHIKDLPGKKLGVDVERDFEPSYQVIPSKKKIVDKLKKAASRSSAVYLAADPDREGEAICQHLSEIFDYTKGLQVFRVLFNEITKNAILEAFQNPSSINTDKVAAQQARRILDRLVGYKISPLLWRNVKTGLSAGRVQSVALRMIVDRENEIRAFVPEEYWNFSALLEGKLPPQFTARATRLDGKKFKIANQEEAEQLLSDLRSGDFVVEDVRRKERQQRPVAPFVTSSLQQEASRKLRFSVKKTMTLAQKLYEGIEVSEGERVGLITYMRTDSTRVSNLAIQDARGLIQSEFGDQYLPSKSPSYKKGKAAQDAHEAIRPTSCARTPEDLKKYLDRDELRLYDLIWKRFLASQMAPAVFDQTEIEISAPRTVFRAVGSILKFDGFLRIYREGFDDAPANGADEGEEGKILPPVEKGEVLQVHEIKHEQKFTQPPPRYTEASLVKALEEKAIGRPSTYSSIISVIQDRKYVEKAQGRFVPTDIGEVVSELLVEHFSELFDYDYTARMEENLDSIESGKQDWVDTMRSFYEHFSSELEKAERSIQQLKREGKPAGITCDLCGAEMVLKWGRYGRFIACSNYPECRNTKELAREEGDNGPSAAEPVEAEPCEKCGKPMVTRKGRYGDFLACSGYPECRNTRRLDQNGEAKEVVPDEMLDEKCPKCGSQLAVKTGRYGKFVACSGYPKCRYIQQETTGVNCPECKKGELTQRKSRRGKVFYGCNNYPKCKFVLWHKPVQESCPECDRPYLLERQTKKNGLLYTCDNPDCKYSREGK